MKTMRKAVKARRRQAHPGMVDFSFGDTEYQIDTNRRKVYHRWVEVETSRTFLIMGAFASARAEVRAK
jgi:hypothetical protein